jgi:hypothetical protein
MPLHPIPSELTYICGKFSFNVPGLKNQDFNIFYFGRGFLFIYKISTVFQTNFFYAYF